MSKQSPNAEDAYGRVIADLKALVVSLHHVIATLEAYRPTVTITVKPDIYGFLQSAHKQEERAQ